MEQLVDELLEDVEDEAAARNAEVFIAVLNRLDGSRDDIRRKILSSFPPTCRAMRARRRLNRLKRYLQNVIDSRESSIYDDHYDPLNSRGYARQVGYIQQRIEYYTHRVNTEVSCKECHSCKTNNGDVFYDRWGKRWNDKFVEPFQVYLEKELPRVVSETTKNLKEELFSLI